MAPRTDRPLRQRTGGTGGRGGAPARTAAMATRRRTLLATELLATAKATKSVSQLWRETHARRSQEGANGAAAYQAQAAAHAGTHTHNGAAGKELARLTGAGGLVRMLVQEDGRKLARDRRRRAKQARAPPKPLAVPRAVLCTASEPQRARSPLGAARRARTRGSRPGSSRASSTGRESLHSRGSLGQGRPHTPGTPLATAAAAALLGGGAGAPQRRASRVALGETAGRDFYACMQSDLLDFDFKPELARRERRGVLEHAEAILRWDPANAAAHAAAYDSDGESSVGRITRPHTPYTPARAARRRLQELTSGGSPAQQRASTPKRRQRQHSLPPPAAAVTSPPRASVILNGTAQPQATIRQRKQWTLASSLFAARLRRSDSASFIDTPAATSAKFAVEWEDVRRHPTLMALMAGGKVVPALRLSVMRRFEAWRSIHAYFCAADERSPHAMRLSAFRAFTEAAGLTQGARGETKRGALDAAFRACVGASGVLDLASFIALTVSLAPAYITGPKGSGMGGGATIGGRRGRVSGSPDTILGRRASSLLSATVDSFFARYINGTLAPAVPAAMTDPNAFRLRRLFTAPAVEALQARERVLRAAFAHYADAGGGYVGLSDGDARMSPSGWAQFCSDAGLLRPATGLTPTAARLVFVWSQPLVIDAATAAERATTLAFEDFVEAVARVADSISPPPVVELREVYRCMGAFPTWEYYAKIDRQVELHIRSQLTPVKGRTSTLHGSGAEGAAAAAQAPPVQARALLRRHSAGVPGVPRRYLDLASIDGVVPSVQAEAHELVFPTEEAVRTKLPSAPSRPLAEKLRQALEVIDRSLKHAHGVRGHEDDDALLLRLSIGGPRPSDVDNGVGLRLPDIHSSASPHLRVRGGRVGRSVAVAPTSNSLLPVL